MTNSGPRTRAGALALALVGLALIGTACSKSTTTASTESTTTTAGATSSTPATTTTVARAPTQSDGLAATLLTPSEVGPGYQVEPTTSTSAEPTPCGGPNPDSVVPPDAEAKVQFVNPTTVVMVEEEIAIYATDALAGENLALISAGVACPNPMTPGSTDPMVITGPTPIAGEVQVPVEELYAWDISNSQFVGTMIVARDGNVLVKFGFVAGDQIGAGSLAPAAVANAGLAKIASFAPGT